MSVVTFHFKELQPSFMHTPSFCGFLLSHVLPDNRHVVRDTFLFIVGINSQEKKHGIQRDFRKILEL